MRANLPAASGQICPRAKKKDSLNIMSECELFTSQTFWGELYSVSLKFALREFLSFTATTHISEKVRQFTCSGVLWFVPSRDECDLKKNEARDQLVSPTKINKKKGEGDHITETMGVAGRGR